MPTTEPAVDPAARLTVVEMRVERRRFAAVRSAWPVRRLVVAAALSPALMALLVAVAGGTATSPEWAVLVGLLALVSAMTLATYVPRPGTGVRLDVGCTPCASISALSVLIAAVVLSGAPHDVPSAIVALGVSGFGLRQRLADPSTCAA
jgi:hypothetical protein